MADRTPMALFMEGVRAIGADEDHDERLSYARGAKGEVYSPPGLDEYIQLLNMSGTPLIKIAIQTLAQRIALGGVHLTPTEGPDKGISDIFRRNRWASRETIVYMNAFTYGYGIVSVWPGANTKQTPQILIEDPQSVHLAWLPGDPFTLDYVVKLTTERKADPSTGDDGLDVGYLYTDAKIRKFHSPSGRHEWTERESIANPLGRIPFVPFIPERDSNGDIAVYIDPLMEIVDAINTLRYHMLLAAQFSAYRQRIATGVDPIVRDANGEPVFKTQVVDGVEELVLDENGMPIPLIQKPGRAGVDRFLVFPGEATKIFDLAESNLQNYTEAIRYLEASFSAASRVPSQFLGIGDFTQVSGDTMEANESGIRTFGAHIQHTFGDAILDLIDLIDAARSAAPRDSLPEVYWKNMEPRSLNQVASATAQMVPAGAPISMFLEMLASSPDQVNRWLQESQTALNRAVGGNIAEAMTGPKPAPDAPPTGEKVPINANTPLPNQE